MNQWVTVAYKHVSFRLNCGRRERRRKEKTDKKGMHSLQHEVSRNVLSAVNTLKKNLLPFKQLLKLVSLYIQSKLRKLIVNQTVLWAY